MKGIFKAFGFASQQDEALQSGPPNQHALIENYMEQMSENNNSTENTNSEVSSPVNGPSSFSSPSSPVANTSHHNTRLSNVDVYNGRSENNGDRRGESEDSPTSSNALTSSLILGTQNEEASTMNKLADMTNNVAISLLPGEVEIDRDSMVFEWNGHSNVKSSWHLGTLTITNFRIVFTPTNVSTYEDVLMFKGSQIPYTSISRAEKIGGRSNKQDHSYLIEIMTKDLNHVKFSFSPNRASRGRLFKYMTQERVQPEHFFCYNHKVALADGDVDGWKVYDPLKEFVRQGCFRPPTNSVKPQWRLTNVNEDYKMCDTYPAHFMVPSDITDEEIRAVALFRSKGRIPALSWFNKETGVALTRSSQPLLGLGIRGKKFKDDYRMIEAIIQANRNNGVEKLMIVDLRPRANAEANRLVKGAGYEKNYKNCDLKFMNIENIHVVRASFTKLMDLCMSTGGMDGNWYQKVEATSWIEHLRSILSASQYVVTVMEREKVSVLTHCSDGWDRTSQVACLSQLMLDPYFRTIEGFAVLVEKEWLAFGHMFHKRMGHGLVNAFFHDERGPIFVQFMDCMFQFISQHPTAFEFNEVFLLHVLDEAYACRYGTFLFDCDRERTLARVRESTPSLWTQFMNRKSFPDIDQYLNPFYDPELTSNPIYPDLRHASIHLWSGYWLRYAKEPNGYEYLSPSASKILQSRGMAIKSELSQMNQYKANAEHTNETTVQLFQREFATMRHEIIELGKQKEDLKKQYEIQLLSYVELCEKQRKELSKWENATSTYVSQENNQKVEIHHNDNGSSEEQTEEKTDKDAQLEEVASERDVWKKKALDLQVELLNSKAVENHADDDMQKEVAHLKQYIAHLEKTLLQVKNQETVSVPPSETPQPERKTLSDQLDGVDETWRQNIE